MDVTSYLPAMKLTAQELAAKMMGEVLEETGITATAGIGTNLYLCKVAMDIVAKHAQPDENGARMATLDERSYRELLWDHRPLTDFWRVGNGYRKKLEEVGLFTMGDIARCSVGEADEYYNEELLYRLFGVNAELLIDHAWGWEPVGMAEIKAYRPETNSISSGQVLQSPYEYEKAELIVREMTDQLVLELVDKHLVTDQMVLTIGYDVDNLKLSKIRDSYRGEVVQDRYGRQVPKHAHGTVNLKRKTSSTKLIMEAVTELYRRIVDPGLLIRRITLVAAGVVDESSVKGEETYQQLELFTDYGAAEREQAEEEERLSKERKLQEAVISLKKKYGKNAVLKGMNLQEGATMRDRNRQIGGHKA
jgi:DNA polymerase V